MPRATGVDWDLAAQDPETGEVRRIVETGGITDCPGRVRCTSFVRAAEWSPEAAGSRSRSLTPASMGRRSLRAVRRWLWVTNAPGDPRQLTTPCHQPPSGSDGAIQEVWAGRPPATGSPTHGSMVRSTSCSSSTPRMARGDRSERRTGTCPGWRGLRTAGGSPTGRRLGPHDRGGWRTAVAAGRLVPRHHRPRLVAPRHTDPCARPGPVPVPGHERRRVGSPRRARGEGCLLQHHLGACRRPDPVHALGQPARRRSVRGLRFPSLDGLTGRLELDRALRLWGVHRVRGLTRCSFPVSRWNPSRLQPMRRLGGGERRRLGAGPAARRDAERFQWPSARAAELGWRRALRVGPRDDRPDRPLDLDPNSETLASRVGFEPTTKGLKVPCSTAELPARGQGTRRLPSVTPRSSLGWSAHAVRNGVRCVLLRAPTRPAIAPTMRTRRARPGR